jgi:hypothetical protein
MPRQTPQSQPPERISVDIDLFRFAYGAFLVHLLKEEECLLFLSLFRDQSFTVESVLEFGDIPGRRTKVHKDPGDETRYLRNLVEHDELMLIYVDLLLLGPALVSAAVNPCVASAPNSDMRTGFAGRVHLMLSASSGRMVYQPTYSLWPITSRAFVRGSSCTISLPLQQAAEQVQRRNRSVQLSSRHSPSLSYAATWDFNLGATIPISLVTVSPSIDHSNAKTQVIKLTFDDQIPPPRMPITP